jgi:hypothetical protein
MNTAKIELIKSTSIPYFPSGSAVEIFNDVLYIVGDDASEILLLDKNYNQLKTSEAKPEVKRISKDEKIDLEASTIIQKEGSSFLLIVGSGSKENREKIVRLPLPFSKSSLPDTIDNSAFLKHLKEKGIDEVNIEGVASTKEAIIFANRANLKNRTNHLIFTSSSFPDTASASSITIKKLVLPNKNTVAGISGLAYDSTNDLLLFTASTEATESSYEDGEIGDSYLGYIKNISTESKEDITPDGFINLSAIDKSFKGQKIESICIEGVTGSTYTLHLVSDNDNGATALYKISLTLKDEKD